MIRIAEVTVAETLVLCLDYFPVQLVPRIERTTAAPPARSDSPPMPPDLAPTSWAFRYLFCGRSHNRTVAATRAVAAQFLCFFFPRSAMTVVGPHEGVSNFVQDRVSDFGLGVQERKFPAQGDRGCAVLTDTEPPHGAVECKVPVAQTMSGHQLLREGFRVFENHSACLAAIHF